MSDDLSATPWAATRDASWYARPDVRSVKAVHMNGRQVREGVMSACGRSLLDDGSHWTPDDVPAALRCQSNGCRQAWPTNEHTEEERA
ncbi:hypothetical protein [Kitasatospora sp. NPDC050543]|uniref:hypothetical protein n=1 Tax=Kitasatospora sp. NPDC050543 TaxID=3364054 RepID=UPI0037B978D6